MTPPVPAQSSLADVTAQCSVTALTAPTATDNCATSITVTNNATLPITAQGTTVVIWTYDDGNGNTVTQSQNVVITGLPYYSSISSTVCGSYTSQSGIVYTASGTYTENLVSVAGCDSIVTLNLIIRQQFIINMTALACQDYTVPSGNATYFTSGVYNDTLTTVYGCDSVLVIQLTILGVDNTVAQNGIVLTANATGAQYQWINCATGVEIWNATNQSFTPIYTGSYAVIVFQNGCYDTSICYTYNNAELLDQADFKSINVYPNPSNGIFTLEAEELIGQPIGIFDINGRLITEMNISNNKTLIDLSGNQRGVYFIRIEDEMIRIILD